jgi:hypothetical protein
MDKKNTRAGIGNTACVDPDHDSYGNTNGT